MKRNIFHILIICGLAILSVGRCKAQLTAEDGTVYIEPLFTYPEAPNFIEDLGSRSDYLMDNFWNDMNFKEKVVNQSALQHAFEVYAAPMRWAQAGKVHNSVKNLLKKVSKNPTLAAQFMKAAEETFHSPRSEVYIDEVYEMFLNGFIDNKKIKPERKKKYVEQLAALKASKAGMPAPGIELIDTVGNSIEPQKGSEFTLYIFGTARDSYLRQLLLKLNTNMALERLCTGGNLGINFINVTPRDSESDEVIASLPEFVIGGYCSRGGSNYDLRNSPSVYLIDGEGKIVNGNLTMEQAFDEIARLKFSN